MLEDEEQTTFDEQDEPLVDVPVEATNVLGVEADEQDAPYMQVSEVETGLQKPRMCTGYSAFLKNVGGPISEKIGDGENRIGTISKVASGMWKKIPHVERERWQKLAQEDIEDSTHQCDLCQRVFTRSKDLRYHLKRQCGEFSCPTCEKIFKTKVNQERHIKVHLQSYKCLECEKMFSSKQGMERHTLTHTQSIPCDVCGKLFSYMCNLKRHKRKVHT